MKYDGGLILGEIRPVDVLIMTPSDLKWILLTKTYQLASSRLARFLAKYLNNKRCDNSTAVLPNEVTFARLERLHFTAKHKPLRLVFNFELTTSPYFEHLGNCLMTTR